MRVTFVLPDVTFSKRSGGYRVHYEMANRLSTRGHQVVIVHKTNSRRVWLRAKLWPLLRHFSSHDFVPWFNFSPGVRVLVTMRVGAMTARGTDVYAFTNWKTLLDLPNVRRSAARVALVWDYEFWAEGDDDLRAAMREAFAQRDVALVAGSVAVRTMLDSMGLHAVATIPPGLDHAEFRCERSIEERARIVGFLNRPGPRRGIPDVVDALRRVRDGDSPPRVLVAGPSGEGLQSWAEWAPAPNDSDLAGFYNQLAVFVLPSLAEGLGLPALEAMACGAAVVVTDNGGNRQFARTGENCLVVPTCAPSGLAEAIIRLLSDDALRQRIARNGMETAATFTWEHSVKGMEEVLERVTDLTGRDRE